MTLEGDVWDNPVNPTDVAQARIMSTNEASVSLYYYSCYNATTEQMLMELDGVAIGDRVGVLNYFGKYLCRGRSD